MRLFVSIPVPEATVQPLLQVQAGLRVGRPVAPENLHITLAFMPDVPQAALEDLHVALEGVRAWPFDVEFGGIDVFGGAQPRLIVALVRRSETLERLQAAVVGAVRSAGVDVHKQGFRPHVTLVRFGGRITPEAVAEVQAFLFDHARSRIAPFVADGMTLTQSTLGHGPPVYERLAAYSFGSALWDGESF